MKKRKSQTPYKISTMSIGDLIQAKAKYGNSHVRANAEKFLASTKKKG